MFPSNMQIGGEQHLATGVTATQPCVSAVAPLASQRCRADTRVVLKKSDAGIFGWSCWLLREEFILAVSVCKAATDALAPPICRRAH